MFLIISFLMSFYNNEPIYVKEFHELNSKKKELEFIEKYHNNTDVSIIAYVVSIEMKQAKYKFFPWDKLKIFNDGKLKLEELILDNPNNIHLRYVRLLIQENTPSFLNYNSSIKKDKDFINKLLLIEDSTDYLDKYILKNTSL
ncbi:hypothetical protein [Pseudofulvibacter geojedonensis]|uniref:Uncharacterized protein n=1 Tax=Pseudofulvibacter geojedonensis TaxID=1123758 RepID=A0ABW3I3K1_9FLAO